MLVDVQASMGEVAKAKTDAKGHYSITEPGNGPYLVRVTHQGGSYFIAAPQGDAPGDIPVYDVAAKVDGVSIEADVLEVETDNGQLKVTERYFVHNTGTPPRTQYNSHGFEVVLPSDAVVDGTAARRPTGLPTSTNLKPTGAKAISPSISRFSRMKAIRTRSSSSAITCPIAAANTPSNRRP